MDFAKIVAAGLPATVAGAPIVYLLESPLLIAGVLPIAVIGIYVLSLLASDAFTDEDTRMAAEFGPLLEKWLPVPSSRR